MKTIYLIGKVNGPKWKLSKDRHADLEFISSDADNHSEHNWGYAYDNFDSCNTDLKEPIQDLVLNKLYGCRAALAYMETPDSFGSIAEIATASIKNIQTHVIINTSNYTKDEMYDAYWFVCAFPNVTVYTVSGINQAYAVASDILDKILKKKSTINWADVEKPTQKQLNYLRLLGYSGELPTSKADAGKLISQFKPK